MIQPPLDETWHNGGDIELALYANSLHNTARALITSWGTPPAPASDWDAAPIVLLYRQAVELKTKALVGEGTDFTRSPADYISLAKTRSLRWVAQHVCSIIRALALEPEFKCEGISSLADFSALMAELELLDPVYVAVFPHMRTGAPPAKLLPHNIVNIATRLDALIGLLDRTTASLSAPGTIPN
jgi:hypothetical protein